MKVNLITSTSTFRPVALPTISVTNSWKKLKEKASLLLESLPLSYSPTRVKASPFRLNLSRLRPNRRLSQLSIIVLVVILLAGLGIFLATRSRGTTLGNSQKKIDQTYSVLARDQNGKALPKYLNLHLTNAEKTNTVLIQGKRANVRNSKLFLLINFEIDNPDNTVYFINPTDLVRYLRSDGKKFAPTIYQGVLQIRPDSTKSSNIGFVVEQNDKNFNIEVGDLDSQKQTLEVKF